MSPNACSTTLATRPKKLRTNRRSASESVSVQAAVWAKLSSCPTSEPASRTLSESGRGDTPVQGIVASAPLVLLEGRYDSTATASGFNSKDSGPKGCLSSSHWYWG